MIPKILAYYLPAYHRIPENDNWYGEGFTEWTTTKKGVQFKSFQSQPRVPLDNNYYDLSSAESIKKQAELAKKYGVDGFCFYHYWFSGRKILEKPSELLLQNTDIDIDFCFAWANEEWRNTWNDKTGDYELLIEQNYDKINDWENHYAYLSRFFHDKRYIKYENKPVFMIYRIERIPDFELKFKILEKEAIKDGFDGIYLIQMINNDYAVEIKSNIISAKVDFEPNKTLCTRDMYAFSTWRIRRVFYNKFVKYSKLHTKILDIVNYKKFCKSLLKKKYIDSNYYYSCFTDWDNTARKGKRGIIFKGSNPEIFKDYFKKIYELSARNNKHYIFIFAWNEWGEGAYLEPDVKNKFGYLESINQVKENYEKK